MEFSIETEQEADGRWIAEVTKLPGVLAYGETKDQAIALARELAVQVIADRIEQGKTAEMSATDAKTGISFDVHGGNVNS